MELHVVVMNLMFIQVERLRVTHTFKYGNSSRSVEYMYMYYFSICVKTVDYV